MRVRAGIASVVMLIALLYAGVTVARSEEKEGIAQLQARYLSLRNTDIDIAKRGEWESLAGEFVDFVERHPGHTDAAQALFKAGILHEQIFSQYEDSDERDSALELFEKVASSYPESTLADDALVRAGDLELFDGGSAKSARKFFERVVKKFPGSDMADVARARIRTVDGKGNFASQPKSALPASSGAAATGPLIVLDPGHGGEDFGAVGVGGLMEKDVVLDVGLRLEKLLISRINARVRLTRRNDLFVPLAERTNFANDFDASLFVSLHINASPKGKASGLETYYLDNTDDAGSKKLAERENSSVQFEGEAGDLQFMLSDLIQNAKLDESIELANLVQRALVRRSKPYFKDLRDLGVRKAPFYVLVGAHMPCILAELFFIDNPLDGRKLADTKFRQMLAEGLFEGINEFLVRQNQPRSKKKGEQSPKKSPKKKKGGTR